MNLTSYVGAITLGLATALLLPYNSSSAQSRNQRSWDNPIERFQEDYRELGRKAGNAFRKKYGDDPHEAAKGAAADILGEAYGVPKKAVKKGLDFLDKSRCPRGARDCR